MRLLRLNVLLIVFVWLSQPSEGTALLKKPANVVPSIRVPQLIQILRTERNANKRGDAAEELGEYDAKAFPDAVTALIDCLQNDPESSVRIEAASAMGSLRPISQQAGFALEQAIQMDSSMGVRMTARRALWQYYLLGYRPGRVTNKLQEQTEEPPLADPPAKTEKKAANPNQEKAPAPYKPMIFGNGSGRFSLPFLRKDRKDEEKSAPTKLIPNRTSGSPSKPAAQPVGNPKPVPMTPPPVEGPILNPPGG